MISALYIDLSDKKTVSYEKEILSNLKASLPEIFTMDIDSESEPSLLSYAIQLLKESNASVIFVSSEKLHSPKILPIAELIIKTPEKYIVFLQGENQWLEKLCKGIGEKYLNKTDDFNLQINHSIHFLKPKSKT